MVGMRRITRWLAGAVILAAVDCAAVIALDLATTQPAQAQWFGNDGYRRPSRSSGGFFGGFFGGGGGGDRRAFENEPAYQAPSDNSRAPSPRKPDLKAEPVTPTTSIVVMGDGMADWLAYGLEDAFSDTPEVAIVRKNKQHSGLLRYEFKSELDWWHVARDILTQEKANYVVMMLGVSDRQNIREKDLAKEADKKEAEKKAAADSKKMPDKPDAKQDAAGTEPATNEAKEAAADKDEGVEQPAIMAPEPAGRRANGIIEFRTDKWAEIYSKRIDDTIAALKSKGVPVFWVGLPSIRGTKSTADAVYLNDLYRARVERAGAIYIDVWDGFVDETGKYSNFGPDYEGQVRRLRSNDGTYFTKYGARKLAHYVEREIRRYMTNRSLQVSLPTGPVPAVPSESRSTVRPLAGPVVPLTVTPSNSDELVGGPGPGGQHGDAIATRVLVKGEPVNAPAGRADDFAWPPGSGSMTPAITAAPRADTSASVAPNAAPAQAAAPSAYVEPEAPGAKKPTQPATAPPPKTAQSTTLKPHQPANNAPRPPAPIQRSSNPFGWLR
jgi:hypothetical protein